MTTTRHQPHRGKGLLALLAATAALAGVQAFAPAPAAAMVAQSMSKEECDELHGSWNSVTHTCKVTIGGGNPEGEALAKAEVNAQAQLRDMQQEEQRREAERRAIAQVQALAARKLEEELEYLDDRAAGVWWRERTQCRVVRADIRYWRLQLADNPGRRRARVVVNNLVKYEGRWDQLDCDGWLSVRDW